MNELADPQLVSRDVTSTHRFLCGLVGEDIQASKSPWIHEREADALGIRLIYSLYDLAETGERGTGVSVLLEAAARLRFAGLNITHPYKQSIIPMLDALSTEAQRIGAVNTVTFVDGRTTGYNTDYLGFAEGLRRGLVGAAFDRVVQLGAGGAGAATANALLEHGTGVLSLHDVERNRADSLARTLASNFGERRVQVVENLAEAVSLADGLVNATPIGMAGHPGLPLPREILRPSLWVTDIVYFPLETELLKEARSAGCRTLDGVTMVVFQAAEAFDLFTGLSADRERMLAAARQHFR